LADEVQVVSPSALNRCEFATSLDQLARRVNVLIGFQQTSDCWLNGRQRGPGRDAKRLTGLTLRAALDAIVSEMPGFSWRMVDSVVVIRPQSAWDDPRDLLNGPMGAFTVTGGSMEDALHTLLSASVPSLRDEHPQNHGHVNHQSGVDNSVSVSFSGGSVLDALNAVVRAHGDLQWQLGYTHGRAVLAIYPRQYPGGAVMESLARFP